MCNPWRTCFWAAAPKGMKSCRTQRTFVCSSIRPPGPLRPEICPLKPKICLKRGQISGLKGQISGLLSQISGPCSIGLQDRCPASSHSNSQSCKAGQQVLLTTYCLWATGWVAAPSHNGEISPSLLLFLRPTPTIPPSRLKSQDPGPNTCVKAQIPALRLNSQPQGLNPSPET